MIPPRRILLVKPSSLGDVVHALPVVSAIREHWPDAELRWLILPAWRSLVEGHPGVSGTILFPRDRFRGPSGWLRAAAWTGTLRDWRPDLAIDLQGLLRSGLFCRLSGASRILGLSDAREGARFLHTESVPVNVRDHAVRRCLAVLGALGIPLPPEPRFDLPAGSLPQGFDPTVPYLLLHPFARGRGKSLDAGMIRTFVQGAGGARVVIVGRGELLGGLPVGVEDWSNRTDLGELIGLLRKASYVVSSDSGPMHLAAALRPDRTLAVHFWSDPLRVGPFPRTAHVWKNGRLAPVSQLDEAWRPEGRAPTGQEMEDLGRFALDRLNAREGSVDGLG